MKYDFKDISFLIHVRIDVDDRLVNLSTVMEYYHHNCDNVEFVIVNDDKKPDPRLKPLKDKYPNSKFLFQENDDVYHRTRALNQASLHTYRKIVIAGDTDVIVYPAYILQCQEQIENDSTIAGIYPYNGLFIHVSDDLKAKIIKEKSIDFLTQYIPEPEDRQPYYKTDNILVAHPHSKGGCIVYSHRHWNTFKGYNPGFIGWGCEDDEIFRRVKGLGFKFLRLENNHAVAWHLPHENTIREKHRFYSNNDKLANYVIAIKEEGEMKEYIRSWEL